MHYLDHLDHYTHLTITGDGRLSWPDWMTHRPIARLRIHLWHLQCSRVCASRIGRISHQRTHLWSRDPSCRRLSPSSSSRETVRTEPGTC